MKSSGYDCKLRESCLYVLILYSIMINYSLVTFHLLEKLEIENRNVSIVLKKIIKNIGLN